MSRFYDAMRRASEDEAAVKRREERRPKPVEVESERDIPAPHRESVRDDSLPDIEFLEPVPIRRAPRESENLPPQVVERSPSQSIHPSYERIIQRLLAFRGGRRHCVILVASAVQGEGASTVCRNLSGALAQNHDDNVVLVDTNLRDPDQGRSGADGLAELLRGEVKLETVLQKEPDTGLNILGCGHAPESPQQVLTVPRLQSVVTALHSKFDWIFLDGPPITTFPEASGLAVVSDGAILVVRAEETRWEVAEEAKKILKQAGLTIVGGVLNRRKYHIPNFIYKRL